MCILTNIICNFRRIFGYRVPKILILGLDNAGRTKILYRLHMGDDVNKIGLIRTHGMNYEVVTYKNFKFQAFEFGPSLKLGWKMYYHNTDAIIYVVDSTDKDKIKANKDCLYNILQDDQLDDAVLLVLANKQDLNGCLTKEEIYQALDLDAIKNRTLNILKTSAKTGEGLDEAMHWLRNALLKK